MYNYSIIEDYNTVIFFFYILGKDLFWKYFVYKKFSSVYYVFPLDFARLTYSILDLEIGLLC